MVSLISPLVGLMLEGGMSDVKLGVLGAVGQHHASGGVMLILLSTGLTAILAHTVACGSSWSPATLAGT